MAFTRRTFARASVHGNSDCGVTYNYKTTDNKADVDTADYFGGADGVADTVHVGDTIIASCADGAAMLFVNSVDPVAKTVDCNDAFAISSASDTD